MWRCFIRHDFALKLAYQRLPNLVCNYVERAESSALIPITGHGPDPLGINLSTGGKKLPIINVFHIKTGQQLRIDTT